MKFNRSIIAVVAGMSLLVLAGCASGSNQASTTETSPAASTENSPAAASPESTTASAGNSHGGQGGQVIEAGDYHLELVPSSSADGTHIDLFLQKGDSHEAIPDAKVTAQVQIPDGSQQSLDMKYDAEGKHYMATVLSSAAGEYKVVVLSDINGEKVNGRFNFTK